MSERRYFVLAHPQARANAVRAVASADEGWRVTIEKPKRSLSQNDAQWPYLEAFSKQLLWPVNGAMTHMTPEEWKDVLTAAFYKETVRIAMGLSGGVVMLGRRTSSMPKDVFSDWLEFLISTAADRGVVVYEDMAQGI